MAKTHAVIGQRGWVWVGTISTDGDELVIRNGAEIVEVRREKTELAARGDGAVARVDLLRDVARHERDVYAHVIARLRDALRLEARASISAMAKRAEELAALQVGER